MKAILLDAAGTLFDLAEPVGETYSRFAKTCGLSLTPETIEKNFRSAFLAISPPDYTSNPNGEAVERNWWRQLVRHATGIENEATLDRLFNPLFDYYEDPAAWKLYPDTLPFLQAAGKHYRLGVVSNFDQRLLPILKGLELEPYFEVIISSSEARAQKPDPAIFQLALQKLALPPREVLHIGDSLTADYEGARACGLHAVHLQRENGDRLSLEKAALTDKEPQSPA